MRTRLIGSWVAAGVVAWVAAGQLSAQVPTLAASVLPISRAVTIGGTATAFATVINTGTTTAQGCGISMPASVPATLTYQTTDPQTNAVTGSSNAPVPIAPGAAQTYVFSVRPTAVFQQVDIALQFTCASGQFAASVPGVNTFLLTSSAQPTPDIVALAATAPNDGIVRATGTTPAAFAVATTNVGAEGVVVVSVEGTGAAATGATLSLCQTNSAAACLQPPTPTVTASFASNQAATFSAFVTGTGPAVPLDPANNRVCVRFRAQNAPVGNVSVGATCVALRVQQAGSGPDSANCMFPAPGFSGNYSYSASADFRLRIVTTGTSSAPLDTSTIESGGFTTVATTPRRVSSLADGRTLVEWPGTRTETTGPGVRIIVDLNDGEYLHLPMQPGESQGSSGAVPGLNIITAPGFSCSGSMTGTKQWRYTFMGMETITVPAGTFTACRFQYDTSKNLESVCGPGWGAGAATDSATMWVVGGLGLVRSVNNANGATTDLTSYTQ